MEDYRNNGILNKIEENNISYKKTIKKILIIYEDDESKIGDTCFKISNIRTIQTIFPKAKIDIFTTNGLLFYLLKNHKLINNLIQLRKWEDIRLKKYNLALCITYREKEFFDYLQSNYEYKIETGKINLPIYSIKLNNYNKSVFPLFNKLYSYQLPKEISEFTKSHEIYISPKEVKWANKWLRKNGLKKGEGLYIIVDRASSRHKLMNNKELCKLITYIKNLKNSKILIFDENNTGKKELYQWMGIDQIENIIFAKQLDLRKALSILASDYVKMIFGPCTGLLHCASGIYNVFEYQGTRKSPIPIMITYTGKYVNEFTNADTWWKDSKVDCLVIREHGLLSNYEVFSLKQLKKADKYDSLSIGLCKEYTFDKIIDYIKKNYQKKLNDLEINLN